MSSVSFLARVFGNKAIFVSSLSFVQISKQLRNPGVNNLINSGAFCRGVKTTSTVHPQPVYNEEEKVLEKVLKEREKSEDLPISLKNPYEKPNRKCILCEHGIEPDYKNTKLLYQFVSPFTGEVYGRHITGLCKKMQEKVKAETLLAVNFGFMSNYLKEVEFLKDPKLCDPERPVRAHPY